MTRKGVCPMKAPSRSISAPNGSSKMFNSVGWLGTGIAAIIGTAASALSALGFRDTNRLSSSSRSPLMYAVTAVPLGIIRSLPFTTVYGGAEGIKVRCLDFAPSAGPFSPCNSRVPRSRAFVPSARFNEFHPDGRSDQAELLRILQAVLVRPADGTRKNQH